MVRNLEVRPAVRPDKHKTYRESTLGKTKRREYRRYYDTIANGKARAREKARRRSVDRYLSREFVSWDGEGGDISPGDHRYFLLANSDGGSISDPHGLSTNDIFSMVHAARKGPIHIIYGGGYDFNCWLRDIPKDSLERLYKTGVVTWEGWRVGWRRGKSFSIARNGKTVTIQDVLPFFQRTFVSACDEYLGHDWESRDMIIKEKANRGTFSYDRIGDVSNYNGAELRVLVRLACELRERLHSADIHLSRWDGPGAIAASLYKRYQTKSHKGYVPDEVARAGRVAYAGGRFELIRKGHSLCGAYQYDIRSAYPAAIKHLPCLAHGRWERTTDIAQFGVYRVITTDPPIEDGAIPQPLFMRNHNGTVVFPNYVDGWYWTPETTLAGELGGHSIVDGWAWRQECSHTPFSFVPELYERRAELKRRGDGGHVGLKLGLNSLYGKLAQQVGWSPGPPLRIPPFHCLEWAGWITSHCRAAVYRASMHAPDDIIAFETDAVFSRVPLPVTLGQGLGEWDETRYDSLTYFKSGMYYGTLADGTEVEKMRGINKGSVTRNDVIAALEEDRQGEMVHIDAEQTRFIGLGQALSQDWSQWRQWVTSPKRLSSALIGKRYDALDSECEGDGWQQTRIGVVTVDQSREYPVEWINPDAQIDYWEARDNAVSEGEEVD